MPIDRFGATEICDVNRLIKSEATSWRKRLSTGRVDTAWTRGAQCPQEREKGTRGLEFMALR